MSGYPVLLLIEGERCVVVGGGRVAARKVEALREAGARVVVVAPKLSPALEALAGRGAIEVRRRGYQSGDLEGAFLAIAATDEEETNALVHREARARGTLVNAVDDPPRCNFYVPAIVRRGDLTISISTRGQSPALAGRVRRQLDELLSPAYADLVALLGSLRDGVRERFPDLERRKEVWLQLVDAGLLERLEEEGPLAGRALAERRLAELAGSPAAP